MSTASPSPRSPQSVSTFVTDHLPLAAFLVSRGHAVTLEPTGSSKILFSFTQGESLSADAAAFNDGSAQVSPAAYDAARIRLRQRMDALKRGAE